MKRISRWLFRILLVLLLLLLLVAALFDEAARRIAEHRIHQATGLEARIGRIDFGLRHPRITLRDFSLGNPGMFGASDLAHFNEVHVEYDRNALRQGSLRLKVLRFHLSELNVITNSQGAVNYLLLVPRTNPPEATATPGGHQGLRGIQFAGVEHLEMTLGKLRLRDLRNPEAATEYDFEIKGATFTEVQSTEDLQAVLTVIALRSGIGWLLEAARDFPSMPPDAETPF